MGVWKKFGIKSNFSSPLFIAWGGGGGGQDFCCKNGALTWSPLTVWFWFPLIESGIFYDPPSFIPVARKSQCCYMQASDIYINTYVSWTLNNNLTYLTIWYELNCPWRVTLLIQIVENKFIVAIVLLTVEFFLISSSSDSPSLLLWHHTIRLCSQTLWCVGNNDIE